MFGNVWFEVREQTLSIIILQGSHSARIMTIDKWWIGKNMFSENTFSDGHWLDSDSVSITNWHWHDIWVPTHWWPSSGMWHQNVGLPTVSEWGLACWCQGLFFVEEWNCWNRSVPWLDLVVIQSMTNSCYWKVIKEKCGHRYSDCYMTVVSEATASGHQPSPGTVPTSMGADTKGLCQLFQRIWIWLEVACLVDEIWLLSWHGFHY